jgi:uncharacterized protein YbjT (DUF2867 family)
MKVAVAGGTGTAGRQIVHALIRRGHHPVILARSTGVDLVTGRGLDDALQGCEAVVDAVSVQTLRASTATAFFEAATGNLVNAASRAGVAHALLLSIVGIDAVDMGYYIGKRAQERRLKAGPLPWTILRATQFHDFPAQVLGQQRGPVAFVPPMRSAPVSAAEVGGYVAALLEAGPQGMAVPIRGPAEHDMVQLARQLIAATRQRRVVLPLPMLGGAGRAIRSGALIPGEPCRIGGQRFAEYLATDTTLPPR